MLDALLYFKVHYRHLMQNFVVFQTILQEMSSVNLEVKKHLAQSSRKSPRSRLNAWRVARGTNLIHA